MSSMRKQQQQHQQQRHLNFHTCRYRRVFPWSTTVVLFLSSCFCSSVFGGRWMNVVAAFTACATSSPVSVSDVDSNSNNLRSSAQVGGRFYPRSNQRHCLHRRQNQHGLYAIRETTFGMGCFWEPSESLLQVDGVLETVVGYTGNPKFDERRRQQQKQASTMVPSYESVCASRDWVEAVRVKFDDDIITYPQLLDVMFDQHKSQLGSRQYASIIFPQSSSQQIDAQDWYDRMVTQQKDRPKDGWKIEWTTIEEPSTFYQAEGYHQNYWRKQRPRFVVIGFLLVVATVGVPCDVISETMNHQIETVANAATIALCLFIALERWFDANVVELS